MTLRIRRTFEADRIRSILVSGPNWLGDAVLTLPTLANLRRSFPAARISLLVCQQVRDLFQASPFIDDLLVIPSRNQFAWAVTALRRRRFELAILLPNSFRAALISVLAGITHRVGYVTDGRGPLLTVGVYPSSVPSLHQADAYLGLLGAFRWDAWEQPTGVAFPSGGDADAERLLAAAGLRLDASFIGVNPGGAYGTAKRWPAERFAEAADLLGDRMGTIALLFGSSKEATLTRAIQQRMRRAAVDLGGKTSLSSLAGLLRWCRLLLTNDTGAMHLAAALNVPCIAIFGPTDPRLTSPLGAEHRNLHQPPPCSPCRYRDCPIDHRCMRAIGVEEVVAAAADLLDGPASASRNNARRAPAVFLDRDGTINEEVGSVQSPDLMRPIQGAGAALKRLGEAGFLRIVVSNQSRVAKGDATEELVETTHRHLLQLLRDVGGSTDGFYYCPHHPEEGRFPFKRTCRCRKPAPGLIHQAAHEHGVDLARSYIVGDQMTDVMLGHRLGLPSVLVLTGFGRETLRQLETVAGPKPSHVASDLLAAAEWILVRSVAT
ncbi:MAG: lipopolysaccharide heptosyltransferase II [Candidatus Methylomirabilis oxyfera]|nr:lipopolysaccharide heptosyltransferase II [Candidatus Methylomirabilis oxyfera]